MTNTWYRATGPYNDVVVSSRVRIARNIKNIPFPSVMNNERSLEVIEKVRSTVESNSLKQYGFKFININQLNEIDKYYLLEKHLLSTTMLEKGINRGLLVTDDENVAIMINEEDHIRMQALYSGEQIDNCFEVITKIDNLFEDNIEYAYGDKYGYLTCCPTNVGTGLRASCMLHLPAIVATNQLNNLLSTLGKLSVAVRGIYGEGSEAKGNLFQISNQITLGTSEPETITNIKGIVGQIIEQERELRHKLVDLNRIKIEDQFYRSLGILKNARLISTDEAVRLLSDLRLGVSCGIIKNIPVNIVDELVIITQPANILKQYGINISEEERDIKRAELIRRKVGNYV